MAAMRDQSLGATPQERLRNQAQQASNVSAGRTPQGQVNPNVAPAQIIAQGNQQVANAGANTINALNKELIELSKNKEFVDGFTKAMNSAFGAPSGAVPQATNNIQTSINNLKNLLPDTKPNPNDRPLQQRPGKAIGGPVDAGNIYRVGEQGEELFKPNVAGDIIPNNQINSFMGSIKTKVSNMFNGPMSSMSAEVNRASSSFKMPKFDFNSLAPEIKSPKIVQPPVPEIRNTAIAQPPSSPSPIQQQTLQSTANENKEPTAPPTNLMPDTGQIGLKDLHVALLELNKSMMKMSSHAENISNHSEKTARFASKSTGNRALA
jgi:hypothetical protein